MHECLGSWADFSAMWHASGCGELSSTHIPIIIHEEAVPHFSGISEKSSVVFLSGFQAIKFDKGTYCLRTKKAIEAARQQFGVGALDASGAMHGEQSTQLR